MGANILVGWKQEIENLSDLNNAIARNKGKPGIPWSQVKKELGID
jgi:hypothetical protein